MGMKEEGRNAPPRTQRPSVNRPLLPRAPKDEELEAEVCPEELEEEVGGAED